jgi:hypothetical protein
MANLLVSDDLWSRIAPLCRRPIRPGQIRADRELMIGQRWLGYAFHPQVGHCLGDAA